MSRNVIAIDALLRSADRLKGTLVSVAGILLRDAERCRLVSPGTDPVRTPREESILLRQPGLWRSAQLLRNIPIGGGPVSVVGSAEVRGVLAASSVSPYKLMVQDLTHLEFEPMRRPGERRVIALEATTRINPRELAEIMRDPFLTDEQKQASIEVIERELQLW